MTGFINPFENSKDILGDIKKKQNELETGEQLEDGFIERTVSEYDFEKEDCVTNTTPNAYTERLNVTEHSSDSVVAEIKNEGQSKYKLNENLFESGGKEKTNKKSLSLMNRFLKKNEQKFSDLKGVLIVLFFIGFAAGIFVGILWGMEDANGFFHGFIRGFVVGFIVCPIGLLIMN